MLAVPVKNSLLYVEPVYISSGNQNSLPELKRIIVAYDDKIVMEETFEKALYKLFDYKAPTENTGAPEQGEVSENQQSLSDKEPENNEIVELFDKIKKSMSEGDWQEFGVGFSELEKEIDRLRNK